MIGIAKEKGGMYYFEIDDWKDRTQSLDFRILQTESNSCRLFQVLLGMEVARSRIGIVILQRIIHSRSSLRNKNVRV